MTGDSVNVTLDLNGFELSRAGGEAVKVTGAASLTIIDSSLGKTGKITGGNPVVSAEKGSSLIIEGGYILN